MDQQSASATAHATPVDIIDALKVVAGNPPKARASFAKGHCVRGRYIPSPDASKVTISRSFTEPSDVLARFSVGGGKPGVPDTNAQVLRGFSIKLGGSSHPTDLVAENAPVHFARTLDQMLSFLKVRAPRADGTPDSEKVQAFSAANPETLNQAKFVAARPLPGSFAGVAYWAVHSFPATNAAGATRYIKFKLVPEAGEISLSEDEAKTKAADFLRADLEARFAAGPIRFAVVALLDRPGDTHLDVTQRWPDEDAREAVNLGTIEITGFAPNEACDGLVFDPSHIAPGLGSPPDEIFAARHAAYGNSFTRRVG